MSKCKYTSIGGQALIEGIMMRGPKKTSLAVRLPDKSIDVSFMNESRLTNKCKIFKAPIIRGIVSMVDSLKTGYKALMISADKSGFTEVEDEKTNQKSKLSAGVMAVVSVIGVVLGVMLSVALFMWVPSFLFDLVNGIAPADISSFKALFEGIFKIAVFVLYVALVSKMNDIKRVFMYHGAEHKTIFCYEKKLPLTVENVRVQSRFHPRCGTSFLILTLIVSIVLSFLLTVIFPQLKSKELRLLWVLIKVLIVPLLVGLSYELIKICGRYDNLFTKIVSAPGTYLQHLTTKEPTDDMIEVAIASMNAVIPENENDNENENKEAQA